MRGGGFQWKSVSAGSYHTCSISIDDVGATCNTDGTCTEYPEPLGKQPAGAITYCPRGVYGSSATVLKNGRYVPCVPTRTNQMLCWGLQTDGQLDIPGVASRPGPGGLAAAAALLTLSVALTRRRAPA